MRRSVLSIVTFLALCWMETEAEAISVVNRQLTGTPQGLTCCAGINASETVTFTSDADLTGENPEGNSQIFTMHADRTGLRQLTNLDARTGSSVIGGVFFEQVDLVARNDDRFSNSFEIYVAEWV